MACSTCGKSKAELDAMRIDNPYSIVDVVRDAISGDLEFSAPVTVESRKTVCKSCHSRRGPVCGECLCLLSGKIRVAASSCPIDKWGPEEVSA